MQKIQLTDFNLVEFTRSATAEAKGIDNSLGLHLTFAHGSLTISWRKRGET